MSEGGNDVDNSGWFAYVRYKSGRKTAFVPILSIKEKKPGHKRKVLFNPTTLTDFNSQEWYSVKTAEDSKDGQPHTWYAHIGKLGESLESLREEIESGRKRIKWPVIDENDSEAMSTATEDMMNEAEVSNPDILKNRLENRQNKKHKKSATDLIHSHLLKNMSNQLSQSSQGDRDASDENEASEASRLREELERLKSELKAKDDRLRALSQFSQQTDVLQHIQRLTDTITTQHSDTNKRIQELENKFDEFIRKSEFSHDYVEAWLRQVPDPVSVSM